MEIEGDFIVSDHVRQQVKEGLFVDSGFEGSGGYHTPDYGYHAHSSNLQ